MTGSAGHGPEPAVSLGEFLQMQANLAGLRTRDVAERFQELADQEAARIADGADAPADLMSEMSFSKSHLDRLYKGMASLPSKRFLRIFLEMTSRTSGIRPEKHRELCRRAEDLLATAHRSQRNRRTASLTSPPHVPTEMTVAALQMQLNLERAQRTEDRLRWALSDTQALMGMLLKIISALRDIIVDLDTQLARSPRGTEDSSPQELAELRRTKARSYKIAAEAQFDQANQRRRLLETLWDQAHETSQRLAIHADFTNTTSFPDGPALPSQQILPNDSLTQPALTDIANALRKIQQYNETEERTTRELQHSVTDDTPLQPDDELAILVSATRLRDAKTRGTALRTLLKNWPVHPDTRDVLVRLAHDEQLAIRLTTAWFLAAKWAGDTAARDALIDLTHDNGPDVRETAVEGLAQGWAGDTAARDAVRALAQDDSPRVRMTVAESLVDSWSDDAVAHTTLRALGHDTAATVRWAVQQGMAAYQNPDTERPEGAERSNSLLVAMRVRPDYTELQPLPLFDTLRRGIEFDSGVTLMVGDNAVGKTVMLTALASLAPKAVTIPSPRHTGSVSIQLARDLEVVWNARRTPEATYYLDDGHIDRSPSDPKVSGVESRVKQWISLLDDMKGRNRLFLIDDFALSIDRQARNQIFEPINELVAQGCQFVITSVHETWAELPNVRVVRIGKRVRRRFLPDPTLGW
ncbi:HEAT repeat domain-containing protein [Streptomyces sp. NPDC058457]|uniref:HEAT repeat domain-containing protein n=1 Tax=Streptomyces sp. NPDC058457 TaxID=3346507 RepID=UPI0036530EB1